MTLSRSSAAAHGYDPGRWGIRCRYRCSQYAERKYPHPDLITAAGLGSGEDFGLHTADALCAIAANAAPFADAGFDIATSNAVLERR
jgi:hypothetical protein